MTARGDRPPSNRANIAGVWRATVVRVAADGRPYVKAPRLSPTTFGPCDVLEGVWTPGAVTEAAGAHTHGLGVDLAIGDRVIVLPLEGRGDEVIVVGRLRP